MRVSRCSFFVVFFFVSLLIFCPILEWAGAAGKTLNVVGLYSETSAGSISYRIGTGNWIVIKAGDSIPANAEITVTVDRDWIELCPSDNPNAVYELSGANGKVTKKVADLFNEKPRIVNFPKAANDPKFTGKLVVKQYLGRQTYQKNKTVERQNIKYGDILEASGTVNIIGINNTLVLVFANGKETKVIGPLKFTVDKVLKGQNLYKFKNVTK